MASVGRFRELVSKLHADVERAIGPQKTASVYFINVGYNSVSHSPGPQTLEMINAIWTADMLGSMAELGTDIACFWALHNFYPPRGGDYGYLSSEGSNAPRLSYYVFPLLSKHLMGDLVASSSGDPLISAYASRTGKRLSLVLINKDKQHEKLLDVTLKGFLPHKQASVWILDGKKLFEQQMDLSSIGGQFPVEIPPYAIMAIDCIDADSVIPPVNIAPRGIATASSVSIIGPHFIPESAVDGKLYTRWNSAAWTKSNGQEAQWFQLAWPEAHQIDSVRIVWGESWATSYKLLSSVDGRMWETIRETNDGRGGVDTTPLRKLKTRYLKIDGARGSKGISAYSLREFEVFEHPSSN